MHPTSCSHYNMDVTSTSYCNVWQGSDSGQGPLPPQHDYPDPALPLAGSFTQIQYPIRCDVRHPLIEDEEREKQ